MRNNAWAALAIVGIILAFFLGFSTITLLASTIFTGTASSPSGMEIYTGNGREELTIVRGGTEGQALKWLANDQIGWADDETTAVTGAGAVAFDAGDDGANESTAINEIATTGDTNSIFTEALDKVTVAVGNNWPTSDTAVAADADPSGCAATQFATDIATSWNLTCAQPAFTDISGAVTDAQVPNTITIDNASTADAATANGANCAAGQAAGGVDTSWAAEDCTAYLQLTGGTLTGTVTITGAAVQLILGGGAQLVLSNLDCSGFANEGTLSTTGSGVVGCFDDDSGAGGSAIIFDIGDDGGNDSTDLQEIATTGCTGGTFSETFTEPSADKMLITCTQVDFSDLSGSATDGQIPNNITIDLAATATSLAGNGANCSAGEAAGGVDAAGAAEDCAAYLLLTGGTVTGTTAVTGSGTQFLLNLDCSGFANGGTLSTTGSGVVHCQDDAGGGVGSSNSFETWVPTAGDNIVADSSTDTATFTSTQGTVSITGTAASDTLDFDAIDVNCTGCIGSGEVAGLDISADTNLTCGRSLTCNDDTVDADTELFMVDKTINIVTPVTGSHTNVIHLSYGSAVTVTKVICGVDTGTMTIQLDERAKATPNTAGTDIMTSALVCDTNSEETTAFDNASIASEAWVNLQLTANSGTQAVIWVTIIGTRDD